MADFAAISEGSHSLNVNELRKGVELIRKLIKMIMNCVRNDKKQMNE